MTVLEIVRAYLEQNGYDGLYASCECACKKDDLAPCGQIGEECEAGYIQPCPLECGEHEYHIGPKT